LAAAKAQAIVFHSEGRCECHWKKNPHQPRDKSLHCVINNSCSSAYVAQGRVNVGVQACKCALFILIAFRVSTVYPA
jgi:hypothetical protein